MILRAFALAVAIAAQAGPARALDEICAEAGPEDGLCEVYNRNDGQSWGQIYQAMFPGDAFRRSVAVAVVIGEYHPDYGNSPPRRRKPNSSATSSSTRPTSTSS